MGNTSQRHEGDNQPSSIMITNQEGVFVIRFDQVIRLEAYRNYTTFHFTSRPPVTVARTIKDYERILPPSIFFRIHKSHVINFRFITQLVKRDGGYLEMSDKSMVPISRYKKKAFMDLQMARAVYLA